MATGARGAFRTRGGDRPPRNNCWINAHACHHRNGLLGGTGRECSADWFLGCADCSVWPVVRSHWTLCGTVAIAFMSDLPARWSMSERIRVLRYTRTKSSASPDISLYHSCTTQRHTKCYSGGQPFQLVTHPDRTEDRPPQRLPNPRRCLSSAGGHAQNQKQTCMVDLNTILE